MKVRDIYVTALDAERLRKLLEGVRLWSSRDRQHLEALEAELDRAHVVSPQEIPGDVVTMNSAVLVKDLDTGAEMALTLVFPSDAGLELGKISILAPVGTALLGYRVGDTIEWKVPGRIRRLRIERMIYQPEAAGDYDR
jgi:regulator of nucleoside diphosphate kinase